MRIAIIGGANYDTEALDKFLWALRDKYPDAEIVTGQGKGAEKHAYESAKLLGFAATQLEVTAQEQEWFGSEALNCQVASILSDADIIVTVGNGSRPTLATNWWHRMNMHERDQRQALVKKKGKYVSHRSPESRITLHHIEAPPKKPRPARKKELIAA